MEISSKAIFLSYASADGEAASRLCDALRAAGIEVWFDKSELRGGDAWDASIREQIRTCGLLVPIISANTQAKVEGYFRLEWKLAVDRSHFMADKRVFLLPVVIDATRMQYAQVPPKFMELQWTYAPGGCPPPEFIDRARKLLSSSDHPPLESNQESAIPSDKSAGRHWRLASLCAVVVLVAVGIGMAVLQARLDQKLSSTTTLSPSASIAGHSSIAVLPFVDMSENKDQEYFSDGLSEELIHRLAQNIELTVIARTSAFQFKGKNLDVRTIAAQLGVTNVLEGSVRKVGSAIRVTAQLIRATDGAHLWSQTYDRTLDDVFKIQGDIANAVAGSLNISLANASADARRSTEPGNGEAYMLMLQAKAMSRVAGTPEQISTAVDFAHRAVAADPNYAEAWAVLSGSLRDSIWVRTPANAERRQIAEESRQAAMRAIELDPTLSLAHAQLAQVFQEWDWDFRAAAAEMKIALQLSPNNSYNLSVLAWLLAKQGDLHKGLELQNRSVTLDPANSSRYSALAMLQYMARDYSGALNSRQHAKNLNAGEPDVHFFNAEVLLARGDAAGFLKELKLEEDDQPRNQCACIVMAYDALGRKVDADAALARLIKQHADDDPYGIGRAYASRGDIDDAFHWFDRAYSVRDSDMVWIKVDPLLKNVQTDPRFKALLDKMKLSDDVTEAAVDHSDGKRGPASDFKIAVNEIAVLAALR